MDAFHMSLSWGVEVIADLIPIYLHLKKLVKDIIYKLIICSQFYSGQAQL